MRNLNMTSKPLINLDWKPAGVTKAAERGDVIVIVDTLSFSTTVATAVSNGAMIYPCFPTDDPASLALSHDAKVAIKRGEVSGEDQFSLSPDSFSNIKPGTRVILPSPNGAVCCRSAVKAQSVFVGTIVNASATAEAISKLINRENLSVTIIACGEREAYGVDSGEIRFALEDYLGAGAIISELEFAKSAEAMVCEKAFLAVRDDLEKIIRECQSGQELVERGYDKDVSIASDINSIDCAVCLKDNWLVRFQSSG